MIGASMGGMIAQHLALEHRDSVRSLTLACTTPGGPQRRAALAAADDRGAAPDSGPKRTFPLVAPALYADDTLQERRARVREDFELRMQDNTSPLTLYAQMGAIAAHDTRPRLRELGGVPTLVVHGLEDNLVPHDRGRELAALIPGARLELVPKCGHLLTTDAEEQVADRDPRAPREARAEGGR